MERCRKDPSLPYQNWKAVALSQYLNVCANSCDARGADVDHFQRATIQASFGIENRAVNLASIGIAFYRRIENGKALLRRIAHLLCQQNASGTGSEGGLLVDKILQGIQKSIARQKLEKGRRFAAGNDQAVYRCKLFRFTNEHRLRSSFTQCIGMRVKVPLNSQHADAGNYLTSCRFYRHV